MKMDFMQERENKMNELMDNKRKSYYVIAGELGYGLYNEDVIALAKMYAKKRHRRKIIALLTDVNFHYEAGKLLKGQADELIEEMKKRA